MTLYGRPNRLIAPTDEFIFKCDMLVCFNFERGQGDMSLGWKESWSSCKGDAQDIADKKGISWNKPDPAVLDYVINT